jgi:hypothetical protein
MDDTKALLKLALELANLVTKSLVFGVLSRDWSEENRPFFWRIDLKYVLSKVVDEGSMVVPAFFALFDFGQIPLKLAANDGCMDGSMS